MSAITPADPASVHMIIYRPMRGPNSKATLTLDQLGPQDLPQSARASRRPALSIPAVHNTNGCACRQDRFAESLCENTIGSAKHGMIPAL